MLPALIAAAAITAVPDAAIHHYELKGAPFGVVPSADSRHLFLATADGEKGLAAYDIGDGMLTRTGFVRLDGLPTDFGLSSDETLAVVAAGAHVYFIDAAKVRAGGDGAILGRMDTSSASINAKVSPDGRFAFVAEEQDSVVTVIDLDKARADHFARSAIIGRIPVGIAPIAIVFSKDGRWIYVIAQRALEDFGWPAECRDETGRDRTYAQGAVVALKADLAVTDPAHAASGIAAALRVACTHAVNAPGATAYVTARGSGAVMTVDTTLLPGHAVKKPSAVSPVGPSPVGIARDGQRLFVALSNRFNQGDGTSSVMVLNAGNLAVTGRIPAGVFPRELAVTPDHHWLFISNFGSKDLEQVDLTAAAEN